MEFRGKYGKKGNNREQSHHAKTFVKKGWKRCAVNEETIRYANYDAGQANMIKYVIRFRAA